METTTGIYPLDRKAVETNSLVVLAKSFHDPTKKHQFYIDQPSVPSISSLLTICSSIEDLKRLDLSASKVINNRTLLPLLKHFLTLNSDVILEKHFRRYLNYVYQTKEHHIAALYDPKSGPTIRIPIIGQHIADILALPKKPVNQAKQTRKRSGKKVNMKLSQLKTNGGNATCDDIMRVMVEIDKEKVSRQYFRYIFFTLVAHF